MADAKGHIKTEAIEDNLFILKLLQIDYKCYVSLYTFFNYICIKYLYRKKIGKLN